MLIVLTGPESSGKSSLTAALARHFDAPWAGEAAREYLTDASYLPSDLLTIATLQQQAEAALFADLAFADTDLQTIFIWWQERFGPAPQSLARAYAAQTERHYLVCAPDLPWQPDPLRENAHDRDRLFELYIDDLERRRLPYDVVRGTGPDRLQTALRALAQRR